MRKNKRRKPMAEINVVPYIDVTLVLLIIFMITTPMLQTGVEVDLPKTESTSDPSKGGAKSSIVISIKADGQYYIAVDGAPDELVQREEINASVTAVLVNNPSTDILINADKSIEYGIVVKVMASLNNAYKNAGISDKKVGLMTQPEDDQ
jgi:biopolymer transport protein TolR